MTKDLNERNTVLDAMKGIAIILVILSHCSVGIPEYFIAGYMPLFYICSGFTYHQRPVKIDLYLKIKRLLVPYAIASVVLIPMYNIWWKLRGDWSFQRMIYSIVGGGIFKICILSII